MRVTRPLLLTVLLALVLVAAIAPGVQAKSAAVPVSGSWVWSEGDIRMMNGLPNGMVFGKIVEIGQWSGTFSAADVYEPYTLMVNKAGNPWFHLYVHFKDATVDMGNGVLLHGDMMMYVKFLAATAGDGATWHIMNGTGDLKHLGGKGTLVWNESGYMDYSGWIWTNR
jgi:hypothetical protein